MENYYLVLSGKPLEGHSDSDVIPALGHLLHMSEEQVQGLLQGRPARIRKKLIKEKATRMMSKIVACGAGCDIEPAGESGSQETASLPTPIETRHPETTEPVGTEAALDVTADQSISLDQELTLDLEDVAVDAEVDASADPGSGTSGEMYDQANPEKAEALELVLDLGSEQEELAHSSDGMQQQPVESLPTEAEDQQQAFSQDWTQNITMASQSPPDQSGVKPANFYEQPHLSYERLSPSNEVPATSKKSSLCLDAARKWFLVVPGSLLLLLAAWGGMQLFGGSTPIASEADDMTMAQIERPPVDPHQAATQSRLDGLASSVRIWMIQYGSGFDPAQVTMDRMQQDLGISAQDMLDGWDTPIQYRVEGDRYLLVSAGADRAFGSGDDKVLEYSAR